jgi:hypothetical protein
MKFSRETGYEKEERHVFGAVVSVLGGKAARGSFASRTDEKPYYLENWWSGRYLGHP